MPSLLFFRSHARCRFISEWVPRHGAKQLGLMHAVTEKLLLGRIASTACEDATYCYRCSVVCVSVCPLDTTVCPAKMAEPIELPFGVWNWVGPGNCGGPSFPAFWRDIFGGNPCDAAFRRSPLIVCFSRVIRKSLEGKQNTAHITKQSYHILLEYTIVRIFDAGTFFHELPIL